MSRIRKDRSKREAWIINENQISKDIDSSSNRNGLKRGLKF